jgi:hypothetical protein
MTKTDLKMVRGLLSGDPNARHRAMVLLEAAQAHAKRHAVKTRPGRAVKAATKDVRQANWQTTKAAVRERSGGRCELCGSAACDTHHILSGPLRKKYEAVNSVADLCRSCHDRIHEGDWGTLNALEGLAITIEAPDFVQASLHRRVQKARQIAATHHPGSTRP